MVRLRSFLKALAGIDEPFSEPEPSPETPPETADRGENVWEGQNVPDGPSPDASTGTASDPTVAPVGAVLRAFGVRRERDLDALTTPPRVIGAAVQLLICVALGVGVTAAHGPMVRLILRLEMESVAVNAPTAAAMVVALLTLVAARRLGVRMRHAERRKLYLRFRSRWSAGPDPARTHVAGGPTSPPDPHT